MKDPLASVVVPVSTDFRSLGQCLESLVRQDFENKEIIVVCDPRAREAASLPQAAKNLRIIREKDPCTTDQLINSGMRAARGQVKILLMPHCIPVGNGWIRSMVEPFDSDEVGAVVSQCFAMGRTESGLPAQLLESIDPQQRRSSRPGLSPQRAVSHLCDAYRASLLADIHYFRGGHMASPGQAIDISIKIADAGYSVVLTDAAVASYNVPERHRRLRGVMREAWLYGYTDAVLDRLYDLRWLNSGVFAAALISLLLLPLAVLSLPAAVILSIALLVWGGFLALRAPLVHWECPVAILNFAAYAAVVLLIRDDWWPGLFGKERHPAIIRQWCWLGTLTGSYLLLVLYSGLQQAARTLRRPRGALYAIPVLLLSVPWLLLAGLGYLRGRVQRRAKAE